MKKLVFVVLMLAGSISHAAVTQAQARQAQAAANALLEASREMLLYANAVNNLFDDGFQLQVIGSTETVTIPQDIQDKLINVDRYNAIKANLVGAFNQLP